MSDLSVIGRDWEHELAALVRSARENLVISSPYVTTVGCQVVKDNLCPNMRAGGQVSVVTDLSPMSICQGATDPSAIQTLSLRGCSLSVSHLPRLHAKVYVADASAAIVTSGNLTAGGLRQNYEYGVRVSEPAVVASIRDDITEYAGLGAVVTAEQLATYCELARDVRETYRRSQQTIARTVRRRFEAVMRRAEDDLVRLRLAGGAMHTVFARTILYVLRKLGPLTTVDIHNRIEGIHPDLCDNTIDRVIDGKRFGKKWKHAVRTAQQQLKKQGKVALVRDRWCAVESATEAGGSRGQA
jgi:hypothetical protein